jgi:hypothetical protein
LRSGSISFDAWSNGWKTLADMPVKHLDAQAAMKTHLSQSVDAGALEGQHGISFAVTSVGDTRSGACIDMSEAAAAMTGWATGAKARPAIIKTASSLRMAEAIFTTLKISQTWGETKLPARKAAGIDQCQNARGRFMPLSVGPTDNCHQFRDLGTLIGLVATRNRVFDTMRHVIPEHFFLDTPERGAHRRNLRDDIDAVAILIHHLGQAADLALDPAQAFLTGCLDVFAHALYIPLLGMGYKTRWRTR